MEIACALSMDFNHRNSGQYRRAKEIVAKKKSRGNHGAAILRNRPVFWLTARPSLTWYGLRLKTFTTLRQHIWI
jgi:hypothetical protein